MDAQILPVDEASEVESRFYLNPSLPVTQTNQFIDNFRNNQRANTQMINTQTRDLGTQVPSNLGGLTGGTGYFTSRYQTPQTNAATQNLRTAAQAQALNTALENEKAMWDKRYQEAYQAYQKRVHDSSKPGGTTGTTDTSTQGGVDYNDNTKAVTVEGVVPGVSGGRTVAIINTDTGEVLGYTGVPFGEDYKKNYSYRLGNYTNADAHVVRRTKRAGDMTKSNAKSGIISVWKLPNGTTTNVDATYYTIVQDDSGAYYAKDRSSGEVTPIGV